MFEITKYNEMKEAGLISVAPAGQPAKEETTIYAVSTKRWDPNTGKALPDYIDSVNKKYLLDRKAALTAEIAAIDAFLLDADKV